MITYRQAGFTDFEALLSLLTEVMEHHEVLPPPPEQLEDTIARILASADHTFLVAESEGKVIGMCALIFSHSTWSGSLACELQDIVVNERHRREHAGEGLVNAAAAFARARGCTRLFLLAEAWNFEAHAFYRRLGLTEKTCLYFERDLRLSEYGSSIGEGNSIGDLS